MKGTLHQIISGSFTIYFIQYVRIYSGNFKECKSTPILVHNFPKSVLCNSAHVMRIANLLLKS